ncbi:hypothetical protein SAMN05444340_1128 [Citreimonas salinaria]|uniref:Uncharacterized protein n=1 Tax=Citreimonas salinaria TaxID=321339 RepID=A0A1H3L8M2_9RHOB|nr:hypothetical protein SAMN05444340_1128 [Citreimonas salinaria]
MPDTTMHPVHVSEPRAACADPYLRWRTGALPEHPSCPGNDHLNAKTGIPARAARLATT